MPKVLFEGAPRSPKAAPRSPKGPPRTAPSPPGDPPGAPGGSLGAPKPTPEAPRSTFERPREASKNIGFIKVKPTLRPRGGPGPMSVLPLGDHWGPFCYSSAPARFVFGLLCAPRSPLNSLPPVLASNSPPRFSQGPFRRPKCSILYRKTCDFAKTPVCPKCSLRAPLGHPRLPQGPPRDPQGRPRVSQGSPRRPWGEPGAPQGPPRASPERLRASNVGKQKHWFYEGKTYTSPQGRARFNGRTASAELLGCLL